jgi:hypothetical protein
MPKLCIYLNQEASEALQSIKQKDENTSKAIARILVEADARKLVEGLKLSTTSQTTA